MIKAPYISCILSLIWLTATAQEPDTTPASTLSVQSPLFILSSENKKVEVSKSEISADSLLIDPESIMAIQVIKGDDAIRQYGQRGQYGVVVIELKKGSIQKLPAEIRIKFDEPAKQ